MKLDDLVERYPRLFHMAEHSSWNGMLKHGLLSTAAVLDLVQASPEDRDKYGRKHRPEKIELESKSGDRFVLRDQKPMNDERLSWCLQGGLKPSDWYQILNSKVFFWVSEDRLLTLLGARAYRNEEHDVLVIDTASLVAKYQKSISLAHINTGNTFPYPANRGRDTFKSISSYPTKSNGRTPRPEVVELVVEHGVPDIADHVIRVDRMKGRAVTGSIYAR